MKQPIPQITPDEDGARLIERPDGFYWQPHRAALSARRDPANSVNTCRQLRKVKDAAPGAAMLELWRGGPMPKPIRSVEEFYAHALAIEHEAAERYGEFEAWFRDRGEDILAGLCGNMARMEGEHFRELVAASRHLRLPAIGAADYAWLDATSPEAPARELFYRVAHPRHLLEIALQAEINAAAFFEHVGLTSDNREVCALARQMAAEERQHVVWVRNALEYHPVEPSGAAAR